MRLFSGIVDNYKKSEAAVVVQDIFEEFRKTDIYPIFGVPEPAVLANKLVAAGWSAKPDVFSGKFGARPHRISVAAFAHAVGLESFESHSDLYTMCGAALEKVLGEIQLHGELYDLKGSDGYLIKAAYQVFARHSDRISEEL